MSRRRLIPKRVILPDPKFGDETLAKFINMVMLDGKKSTAERIVYVPPAAMPEPAGSSPAPRAPVRPRVVSAPALTLSRREASPVSRPERVTQR